MNLRTAVFASVAALVVFGAGVLVGQNKFNKPKSIVHVVTIRWKSDATAEQKKAALDAVDTMAGKVPGITNVWTKGIKVQGEGYSDAFAIEFRDKAAFDAYANNQAHKDFESVYLPVRDRSTTHDITN
jgi:hypothetical protein